MICYGVRWSGPPIILKKCSYLQQKGLYLVSRKIGPQMLITSVLMTLFDSLCHVCEPRYLEPTILTLFGIPRLAQNCHFGVFCF